MKSRIFASPILLLCGLLWLAGCAAIDNELPDLSHRDEVPDAVKAEPRLVETRPPVAEDAPWPRLGDVPFKPHDFSTQAVYDHYMNELAFHRDEARSAKEDVLENSPVVPVTGGVAPQGAGLMAPQFPQAGNK